MVSNASITTCTKRHPIREQWHPGLWLKLLNQHGRWIRCYANGFYLKKYVDQTRSLIMHLDQVIHHWWFSGCDKWRISPLPKHLHIMENSSLTSILIIRSYGNTSVGPPWWIKLVQLGMRLFVTLDTDHPHINDKTTPNRHFRITYQVVGYFLH
jgi:hypothetical protein